MSDTTEHDTRSVEPLWYAREVSAYLNVSQAILSRWRRERIGPPFLRVGGISRYNPATVRTWVNEQELAHG